MRDKIPLFGGFALLSLSIWMKHLGATLVIGIIGLGLIYVGFREAEKKK